MVYEQYPAAVEESFRIIKRTIVDYDDDSSDAGSVVSDGEGDTSSVDYSPPSPITPPT